jgi:hypothetical protein
MPGKTPLQHTKASLLKSGFHAMSEHERFLKIDAGLRSAAICLQRAAQRVVHNR